MKQILFLPLLLVFSCGTSKNKNASIQLNSEKQLRVVASLVVSDEKKCAFYLSYNQDGNEVRIIPTNLDDRYKQSGMRLRFNYTEVGYSKKCNCKEVLLEDVSPLRGN